MAFNATVTFTGICALVRDPSLPKAMVILPEAWDQKPVLPDPAQDAAPLRRHRAFLRIDARHLSGPEGAFLVLYLNGESLPGADVTFVTQGGGTGIFYDIPGLAPLGDIAPGHSLVDPALLSATPLAGRLAARFHLDRGTLVAEAATNPDGSPLSWAFPGTLHPQGAVIEQGLAHQMGLYFAGLTSLKVRIHPYGGSQFELDLLPVNNSVELAVAHLCDDNTLRWPNQSDPAESSPDEDFRWYFELLTDSDKQDLIQTLHSALPLPLPHIVQSVPNGQGVNCFPADTKPQTIP